jgi:hypothetical protein
MNRMVIGTMGLLVVALVVALILLRSGSDSRDSAPDVVQLSEPQMTAGADQHHQLPTHVISDAADEVEHVDRSVSPAVGASADEVWHERADIDWVDVDANDRRMTRSDLQLAESLSEVEPVDLTAPIGRMQRMPPARSEQRIEREVPPGAVVLGRGQPGWEAVDNPGLILSAPNLGSVPVSMPD